MLNFFGTGAKFDVGVDKNHEINFHWPNQGDPWMQGVGHAILTATGIQIGIMTLALVSFKDLKVGGRPHVFWTVSLFRGPLSEKLTF